jgi:hypothetical protein
MISSIRNSKNIREGGENMDKWERLACGHIYDPAVGDPDRGELVCSIVLPRNALETPLGYPIEGTTTHAWIEHLHFDTRGDTMNMSNQGLRLRIKPGYWRR